MKNNITIKSIVSLIITSLLVLIIVIGGVLIGTKIGKEIKEKDFLVQENEKNNSNDANRETLTNNQKNITTDELEKIISSVNFEDETIVDEVIDENSTESAIIIE